MKSWFNFVNACVGENNVIQIYWLPVAGDTTKLTAANVENRPRPHMNMIPPRDLFKIDSD